MIRNQTIKEKISIGQKAWQLFIDNNCQDKALFDYAHELGISPTTLKLNYLEFFKNQTLKPKPTKEELAIYQKHITEKIVKASNSPERETVIQDLLNQRFAKELLNYITQSKYSLSEIFQIMDAFIKSNPNSSDCRRVIQIDAFLKENKNNPLLIEKAERDSITKTNEADYKLTIMRQIAKQYLNNDSISLNTILATYQKDFTINDFNHYLEVLKNGSPQDQSLITSLINKNEEKQHELHETIVMVIDYLKKANENKTNFSILDYYSITSIEPKTLLTYARKITTKNELPVLHFNTLYRALNPYLNDKVLSINELNKYHQESENIGIIGQEEVISYLKAIPAPITESTYMAAYHTYNNGNIKNNFSQVA